MSARTERRRSERQHADAALCGMALAEWLALDRQERKRRLQAARAGGAS